MYPSVRDAPVVAPAPRPAPDGPPPGPRQRRPLRGVGATAVLLGVTSLFTDASSEMVAAVLPLYLTAYLGLTPFQFGFVEGVYQGVTALVRLAGGVAADASGRPKVVAFTGYALSALAKVALLPVTGLAAVTAVLAADRVGKGIRTAPRDAMIAATARPEALGRAFGVHRALDTVGAMAGPLLAFVLLAALPGAWDVVFVTSFVLAVVGLAVLGLFVPDIRRRSGAAPPSPRDLRAALASPPFARVAVAAGLLAVLTVSDGFLYLVLARRADLPAELFPLLFVATATTYMLLAVPVGRLADRVGRVRVFLAGHVLLLAAYGVLAGAGDGVPVALVASVALGLLGAYYAATDGVLSAASAPLLPDELRASGLALLQTVVALGRFGSALAFGAAWTVADPVIALVGWAVALVAAIPVAALLLRRDEGAR